MRAITGTIISAGFLLIILSGSCLFTAVPVIKSSSLGSVINQHIEQTVNQNGGQPANQHVGKPNCEVHLGFNLVCHVPMLDGYLDLTNYTQSGNIQELDVYCDAKKYLPSILIDGFFESLGNTLTGISIYDCNFIKIPRDAFKGLKQLHRLWINDRSKSATGRIGLGILNGSNSTQQTKAALAIHSATTTCNHDNLVLPDGIFSELYKLFSLHLDSMQLNNSIWQVVKILSKLQILYLRKNNITSIDIISINKLQNLAWLNLDDNYIQVITNGTFESLSFLRSLSLSSNRIRLIEREALKRLPALNNLCLAENSISTIEMETFKALTELYTLDMSGNSIHTLEMDTFKVLTRLNTLDMSGNNIRTLEMDTFKGLTGLYKLDLSGNSIHTLEKDTFRGLTRLKTLDLSGNSINTFAMDAFKGVTGIYTLDLSGNSISILKMDTFKGLPGLHRLDLSENSLQTLQMDKFKGLTGLKTLDLSGNSISILEMDTFKELTVLGVLNLSRNSIRTLERNTFKRLPGLHRLDLSENSLQTLQMDTFKGLTGLKTLDLSGNSISILEMDTFKELTVLGVLYLSGNSIRTLERNTFKELTGLHTLDLSGNNIRNIEMNTFNGLKNLLQINLTRNSLKIIEQDTFKGLNSLRLLLLADNQVEAIAETALSRLSFLNKLDISYNLIERLPKFPSSLRSLELRYNNIVEPNSSAFARCRNLSTLGLSHNKISVYNISNTIKELNLSYNDLNIASLKLSQDLRYADLRYNQIKSLLINIVKKYGFQYADWSGYVYLAGKGHSFQCTCSLDVLSNESTFHYNSINGLYHIWNFTSLNCSSGNKFEPGEITGFSANSYLCNTSCHEKCLCYLWRFRDENINIVNCKSAGFKAVPFNISILSTILDLSGNTLPSLTSGNFGGLSQLVELYLNASKINRIQKGTFRKLSSVMKLDLGHNNIRRLDSGTFIGLSRLSYLDLSFNGIHAIMDSTFESLKRLKYLDLAKNELETISSSDIENMYTVKLLYLSNNPWSCNCTFLENFIPLTTTNSVQDQTDIICFTSNKTEYKLIKIHLPELCPNSPDSEKPQQTSTAEIALYCVVGVTVLGIICFIVLFRNRKLLKLWFFIKFGWKSASLETDEMDRTYDAFVSYSHADEAFVTRELMPRLEEPRQGRLGYNLCVHFRDFPVGGHIPETILDAVDDSKRVIMILSDNFLSSEWCNYEFQAAHHQLLTEWKNRIIMVLLHDLNPDLLDRQLKLYLSTRTYVKLGDPLLWDKIEYAMPERKQPSEEDFQAENMNNQVDDMQAEGDENTSDDEQLLD